MLLENYWINFHYALYIWVQCCTHLTQIDPAILHTFQRHFRYGGNMYVFVYVFLNKEFVIRRTKNKNLYGDVFGFIWVRNRYQMFIWSHHKIFRIESLKLIWVYLFIASSNLSRNTNNPIPIHCMFYTMLYCTVLCCSLHWVNECGLMILNFVDSN